MAVSTSTASGQNYATASGDTDPLNSAFWKGLPADEQAILEEWAVNLMSNSGYTFDITHQDLVNIAKSGTFTNERDFDSWVYGNQMNDSQRASTPWVAYAMSHDQYQAVTNSFSEAWAKLTGGDPNDSTFQDFQKQALSGGWNSAQLEQHLMQNQNVLNTYGWLKYGMTYQQFSQFKQGQHTAFGRDLSNAEALNVYRYDQPAAGRSFSVQQKPQQQSQQAAPGVAETAVVR